MCLRRPRRDAEPRRDLHVRAAMCDQLDDLQLALGGGGTFLFACRHGADATAAPKDELLADGGIRPGSPEAADEARLVAATVRLHELVLRERADAQEQVELVAQVG